jgi:hypothetical protein
MSRALIVLVGAWGLLAAQGASAAGTSAVSERFLILSRELRVHRAEMLSRFSDEHRETPSSDKTGLRVYLRWAPPSQEKLRNINLVLESDGSGFRESIPVREESEWGLYWYSALIPRPRGDVGILRLKVDVEFRRFKTPFRSVREVEVFEGSLPIVMSDRAAPPLRIVVELESSSPFAEQGQGGRALKMSLLDRDRGSAL